MSQLFLPFQSNSTADIFAKEDFLIVAENLSAFNALTKFCSQSDFANSKFPALILKGPKSCGKTHLLHFLGHKVGAEFLNKDNISTVNPVNFFEKNSFYILEDVENIKDEELILRLFNSALEAEAFLIISSSKTLKFTIKDLESRLQNLFLVEIENPDLDTITQLLMNLFSRKQINLSRPVIDFVSNNIERSYEAILLAVKLIEFHTQEDGKALKMPKIREIFSLIDKNNDK